MCVRGGVERRGDGDGDGDGADGGVGSEGMEGTARKKSLRRIPAYMVVHLHPDHRYPAIINAYASVLRRIKPT